MAHGQPVLARLQLSQDAGVGGAAAVAIPGQDPPRVGRPMRREHGVAGISVVMIGVPETEAANGNRGWCTWARLDCQCCVDRIRRDRCRVHSVTFAARSSRAATVWLVPRRLHGRNGRRPWVKDGKRLDECSSKFGGGTAKNTANPACAEGPNALSQAPRSVRSGSGAALDRQTPMVVARQLNHFDDMSADVVATQGPGCCDPMMAVENVVLAAPCPHLDGRE